MSVADIADALKVTQRTVVALEAERYEELPPRPYIRGYVQRYARVVGLDAAALTVASDGVEVRAGLAGGRAAIPVDVVQRLRPGELGSGVRQHRLGFRHPDRRCPLVGLAWRERRTDGPRSRAEYGQGGFGTC